MNQASFNERAEKLENAFFANLDAQLTENIRASLNKDKTAEELSVLSGITEPSVLASMVNAGVTGRSMTALRIFPLVAVAWADNIIQESERELVLESASKQGLPPKTPAGTLLGDWLIQKPDESVFQAWEAYARSLVAKLGPDDAVSLKETIRSEIHAVASAAGGVLGWAAVSKGESEVMQRITLALDGE